MASLHQTTELTKTIVKWIILGSSALFVCIALIRFGITIKQRFFPTPPPPPKVAFGQLPAIPFPANTSSDDLTYTIDTIDGNLPSFPDRAIIYPLKISEPNLLNLSRAKEKVNNAGLQNDNYTPLQEREITNSLYEWQEPSGLQRKVQMDIVTFNFTLSSDYLTDPEILSGVNLPPENIAENTAQNFISSMGYTFDDIDDQKTKTELLALQNNALIPATSLSTAQIVRVSFYQKDIENLPVVYPYPPESTMTLLIGSAIPDGRVVEAKYTHQMIDDSSSTDYPIKTAAEAYDDLKNGKAYIASFTGGTKNIAIKNVSLGYYLGYQTQQYIMPVIIFEGNNNFIAYVSAVKDNWIKSDQ